MVVLVLQKGTDITVVLVDRHNHQELSKDIPIADVDTTTAWEEQIHDAQRTKTIAATHWYT